MKYGIFALGLLAVASLFSACSGTQSSAPVPKPVPADAGADAMTDADAGVVMSGCAVDADCAQGVCDSAAHVCVECRTTATCRTGERCSAGHCVNATPCTAGTYSCDGASLFLCSPQGELEFNRDCAKSEYCDPRRAQCQPRVCKPSVASCAGAKIQVCNDEGSDFIPKKLCSLSQLCRDGECLDIGCVPNTTFCGDGGVWKCGGDGTSSAPEEHCTSSQFCLEKDHAASCSATACFAGDALCLGNTATQCKPDGSGPKPGGTDCSAANQLCYSGECRDPVCTPGQKLCDKNSLYLCAEAGTGKTLITECGDTASCDAATGVCRPRICEAGKLSCDGARVVTCNEAGTGWLQSGPDCGASHSLCGNGACKPIICQANQRSCKDDNTYLCSDDGTSLSLANSCVDIGWHCVPNGTYAYCAPYRCQPNSAGCNGNLLTSCKADGSDWAAGGTDCALSDGVCNGSKCVPKLCNPWTKFCADGNVQQCDYLGTASSVAQVCAYGTFCDHAACVPTPCLPDTDDSCAGEKFGHCAADGMSVIAASASDCGAAAKICTAQGCAPSAVDTLAEPNQVGASNNYYNLYADVIDVRSARKLTAIEMYLSLPAPRSLAWVIYQKILVNGNAVFSLKYQKTTSASGSGYQSAGPISFQLATNQAYAIGVSIATGSFAYYFDTPNTTSVMAFAAVSGSFSAAYASSIANPYLTNSLYSLRLTTAPP